MATTLAVELPDDVVDALDSAASAQDRDRNLLLNDALVQYLSLEEYHREQIEAGMRDLEEGRVVDHATVVAQFEQWKAKLRERS